MNEKIQRWRVRQGASTATVTAPDHAAALGRGREIGFDDPDSVVLIDPLYRVSYMERGRAEATGIYYDKAKCEKTLANFRRTGRAWLQESLDTGITWRTIPE